jgi:hypothetical protein
VRDGRYLLAFQNLHAGQMRERRRDGRSSVTSPFGITSFRIEIRPLRPAWLGSAPTTRRGPPRLASDAKNWHTRERWNMARGHRIFAGGSSSHADVDRPRHHPTRRRMTGGVGAMVTKTPGPVRETRG